MKDDSDVAHVFLRKVLYNLKDSWFTLQNCIYFINEACSQYKNYKNFTNLCHHMPDFQLADESIFFLHHMEKAPVTI